MRTGEKKTFKNMNLLKRRFADKVNGYFHNTPLFESHVPNK